MSSAMPIFLCIVALLKWTVLGANTKLNTLHRKKPHVKHQSLEKKRLRYKHPLFRVLDYTATTSLQTIGSCGNVLVTNPLLKRFYVQHLIIFLKNNSQHPLATTWQLVGECIFFPSKVPKGCQLVSRPLDGMLSSLFLDIIASFLSASSHTLKTCS